MTILAPGPALPDPSVDSGPGLAVVKRPGRTLRITSIVLTLFAIGALFAVVGFQALIVRNQGHLDGLNASIEEITRANQRLRLQVAEMEAPDRVRSVAIINLGMVVPDGVSYLEPISVEEFRPIENDSK